MILVTGAKGNVGTEVCTALARRGVPFTRAVTRPDQCSTDRQLDFLNPATFADALKAIQQVFLVRPPALSKPEQDMRPFLEACKQQGVAQVVFLSLQGVERNRFTPHSKIENIIQRIGLPYTFLRPSFYMQNLTMQHREEIKIENQLFLPAGKGKTNFIDVRDIADAAAVVLTEEGHINRAYELTGSDSYDYDEVATMLSNVLGRKITYAQPGVFRYLFKSLKRGNPFSYALVTAIIYTIARLGKADHFSSELPSLTGKAPRSLSDFLEEHQQIWQTT